MTETIKAYYDMYSPAGDVITLATCFVFVILIRAAFISKSRNYTLFKVMVGMLAVSAVGSLGYYVAIGHFDTVSVSVVYVLRWIYHLPLFVNLFISVLYTVEPLHLDAHQEKLIVVIASVGLGVWSLYEVLGSLLEFGFYIEKNGEVHNGFNAFPIGYVFFVALIVILLVKYRNRIFRQILLGILGALAVSYGVMVVQGLHHQTSYTTASFLFPIFALLYLIHSNPYDIEIGAVNVNAFEDMISYSYAHQQEMLLMSLFMHDFEGAGRKYPHQFQDIIRHFSSQYFKGAVLFQISNGRVILALETARNPHYERSIDQMLDDFMHTYQEYRLDYKIVCLTTIDEISKNNDYVGVIQYVESKMPENSVHRMEEKDFQAYHKHCYILNQLADIYKKNDLDDERVKVYCQPVFNTMTEKYDTAEVLMRLQLEDLGMVFPDQFIPLAEEYNYIHTLSLIILNKTCRWISTMLEKGFLVKRISVNFSMSDIREADFCSNIMSIINERGIPSEKVAIEITESQNESDFRVLKQKITELRNNGIKFYLDDFGTGYSNFERIMELPFDIIKFDRSMVIASGMSIKSETMVSYLAHMFSDMNYAVLYEGIETAHDEEMCKGMCARYLQGYKYSRPIPIEQLTEYFELTA